MNIRKLTISCALFLVFTIGLSLHSSQVLAQKEIIFYLKSGDFSALRQQLPFIRKKYPNDPLLPYAQAILTTDGKSALKIFQKLSKKYKKKRWLPSVLIRIAQYHYVQGYYISAKSEFLQVAAEYPNASIAPEALYQAALSWMAMASTDSARAVLEKVVEKYYGTKIAELAARDLKEISGAAAKPEKNSTSGLAVFTVQTGAFLSKDNAMIQLQFFEQKGIRGTIGSKKIDGKTLYLVWVGKFQSNTKAAAYGEHLKKKFKVPYRIVER
ncbi:tol-pal system protein YbgF [bacterium BMS3Bbin03]|nr:tol-pal system protein YbgF [bacterium BMS3Bbin03]